MSELKKLYVAAQERYALENQRLFDKKRKEHDEMVAGAPQAVVDRLRSAARIGHESATIKFENIDSYFEYPKMEKAIRERLTQDYPEIEFRIDNYPGGRVEVYAKGWAN